MKSRLPKSPLALLACFFFTVTLHAQVLNLTPGSHFVMNGTPAVIVNNAAIKNNGTFSSGSGTVYFTGYSDTTISYISGDSTTLLSNFNVNKSSHGVALKGVVGITNVLTMTGGNLYADSNLVIKSSSSNTARVAPVPTSCNIVGKAVVERYTPARRAWALVTAPVTNSNSIRNSWQNGGVYSPGAGTLITGPSPTTANGLDASPQNNYSMETFNYSTQGFAYVKNTNTPVSPTNNGSADNAGYFLFVRGDRNSNNTNVTQWNSTTLSSSGNLQIGDQKFTCASTALKYTLIGNPYASPIDFNNVAVSNVIKRFIVWDPTLNQLGGYVVLDDILNIGSFTKSVLASIQNNIIQSGQAFFVQTLLSAPASITIKESSKSSANNTFVFRPADDVTIQAIATNLYLVNSDSTTTLADAVLAQYNDQFDTAVDWQDARKFGNVNETFGIIRNGLNMAIERRPVITSSDTMFFNLAGTTARDYRFEFIPSNFSQSPLMPVLVDNYLKTRTPISLSSNTDIDFSVTSVAASSAVNRFMVVFQPAGLLPVTFTTVKAYSKNTGVEVEWDVQNELNILQYEVQKSSDGTHFSSANITIATGNNNSSVNYSWLDASPVSGYNYYRIKSIDKDGNVEFSQVIRVMIGKAESDISVYPNPVTNNVMNIQFSNQPLGNYEIRLVNTGGQTVCSKEIVVSSSNMAQGISLPSTLAKGNYELKITGPQNSETVQKIIIE